MIFRHGKSWRTRRAFEEAAASYESARRVADRKGFWMVEYLRARRRSDPMLKAYARRMHFLRAAETKI